MIKQIGVFLLIFFIVIGIFFLFTYAGHEIQKEINQSSSEKIYQGPVPLGDDLEHFRQTGITKPLINK